MTTPTNPTNDPFEEQLRQLLKAEADTVTTSPEALNLIRERTENSRGSFWFGLPWLRPTLAVAGAALIAASVVISSPQVRDQVLEIVPAGADRAGTPPEQDQDGGVISSGPSGDAEAGGVRPEQSQPQDPAASPSSEDEEEDSPSKEGDDTVTECPSPREEPSATATNEEERKEGSAKEDCEPTDDPSSAPGGDGGGDDAAPGDGGGDGGGSGDNGNDDGDGVPGGGEEAAGGGSGGGETNGRASAEN
ncbi:hypothetical protein [Nocardiopsis sp. ATB16-24]|uniref:hypothetical protein n=1 Tax=Nocardiopsis sp. ATB16-24 TaxID=3019555 RepID=UPI0025523900|nr:hypothetical protein [Nocardiopsis sp. ATB16-24]